VAVCIAVGRRVAQMRAGEELAPERSTHHHLLVGFLVVSVFGIVAMLLDLIGGIVQPLAFLCDVLDIFIFTFAATLGYGAFLLSRFGGQLPGGQPAFLPNRPWHGTTPPPPGSPPSPPGTPPAGPPPPPATPPPVPPPASPAASAGPPPSGEEPPASGGESGRDEERPPSA
jgi:hypothetical protein